MFPNSYSVFVLFFTFCSTILAQTNDTNRPQAVNKSPWNSNFKTALQINQIAFNNDWQGGGVSNLAVNNKIDYKVNYKKGTWALDNNIKLAYGITKIDDEEKIRKTEDNLSFNTTLFKNIKNSLWSYSTFFNFKSQFTKGYNYKKDGNRTLISNSFSPAVYQFGPGLLYKKDKNLKINVAPSTIKAITVDDFFTDKEDAFGVDQGDTKNIEFGASIIANYKFDFVKNVTIENLVNVYANYLGAIGNIDINYTLSMNSKINKHMSANFSLQTIYDEDTVSALQVKELISIGINYEI